MFQYKIGAAVGERHLMRKMGKEKIEVAKEKKINVSRFW